MQQDVKFVRSLKWYAPEYWLRYELATPFEDVPVQSLSSRLSQIAYPAFFQQFGIESELKVLIEEGSLLTKIIKRGLIILTTYGGARAGIHFLGDDFKRFGDLLEPTISGIIQKYVHGGPYKITHRGVQGRLDEALRKYKGGSIGLEQLTHQIILIFRMVIDYGDSETVLPFYQSYVEQHCPGAIDWSSMPQDILFHLL